MIAFVRGALVSKKPTEVLVDVNGIGYRLFVPTSTFERLPERGQQVRLLTHYHVREDAHTLYGFFAESERAAFEMMLGVTGIGPRLALAALSAMTPAELRTHILSGDAGFLTSIPGVGRKTAERLIVELRDRFAETVEPEDPALAGTGARGADSGARADALAAMEQLGYSRAAAEKALLVVLRKHPEVTSADEMVRRALRER